MPGESASSSAASDQVFNTQGGIYVNQPNFLAWMIVGIGLVLLAFVFKKRKKK